MLVVIPELAEPVDPEEAERSKETSRLLTEIQEFRGRTR
jgi:hypothetical protein